MNNTPHPIAIRHGRVLSDAHDAGAPADILIVGNRIEQIAAPGALSVSGAQEIDATDCLVMPGLINGHTHAHGGLGRGLVEDCVSLEGFLAQAGAANGSRTLADVGLSARLGAVEMIRHGCTACIDMATESAAPTVAGLLEVGAAYQQAGMRAVIAPMIADRTLYQAYPALLDHLAPAQRATMAALRMPDAASLLAMCREAQAVWPHERSLLQLGVGPTIALHCSDELLQGCARISEQFGVPLQTHLAESKLQALFGRQLQNESPVQRLARLGCLSERTSVAHAIWLDDEDIATLARHGVTAIHNPLSNLRLGSGIAPLRRLLDAGVAAGVGTDGTSTSDGQNMFEAIRMASLLTRVASPDWSRWVGAQQALGLALSGGARALGQPRQLGRMEAGCLADLLVIDLSQAHFVPLRQLLQQLVLAESGAGVRQVMVNGRLILDDGRVLGIDEQQLRRDAEAAAKRLDAANEAALAGAAAMHAGAGRFCAAAGSAPFHIERRMTP